MAGRRIRLWWDMCSRFELNARPRDLARRFGVDEIPEGFSTGEIRPTNAVLCIGSEGPRLSAWGLGVEWDKKPIINARAETLAEKRTFQPLLQSRCLVPASAYFEWRRDGGLRRKNRISLRNAGLFAFAGLTDGRRVTIVTRPSISAIAHIHGRMPVILERGSETAWIDPAKAFRNVAALAGIRQGFDLKAVEDVAPPPRQGDLFGP